MPNALLVCPEFPPSYWGFKFALDFVGKRSSMPPLGLITVAAMFPDDFALRVVDMNVQPLRDADIEWADLVLTSTMVVQRDSLHEVVARCNRAGVPVACGGPHPTSFHEEISRRFPEGGGVDHFVLDEVEETFAQFLADFRAGTARRVYRAPAKPDVTKTPLPRFDLLDLDAYGSMAVQFSRGCPFDCEFCDITRLYGRVPRTKEPAQVLAELDLLHALGWRGSVFIVDDNFIGNKRAAMELLRALTPWQRERGHPFMLFTEASVNVAHVEGMLPAMAEAGFTMLFLGIESPNQAALEKTTKPQNTSRKEDSRSFLLRSVREIQRHGIEVSGGFIIGLDGDTEFDSHVEFIQAAGIPMAMAGLLTALKDTNLHQRLAAEGRLLDDSTGNNTDIVLNFVPAMPAERLVAEYRRVVRALYEPGLESYFERCWTMLEQLGGGERRVFRVAKGELAALPKSLLRQAFSRQGPAYLRFLGRVLLHRPKAFPRAVRLAIMGYHFEKVTSRTLEVDDFSAYVQRELVALKERVAESRRTSGERLDAVVRDAHAMLARVQGRHGRLHADIRHAARQALDRFRAAVDAQLAGFEGDVTCK